MRVLVDLSQASARIALAEADDFGRFCVEARGGTPDELGATLQARGVGRLEGDDALVAVEALRRLAPRRDAAWDDGLEQMLAYARTKGWTSADGSAIRAHVEATA